MTDLLAGLPLAERRLIVGEAARLLAALPDCRTKAEAEALRPRYLPADGKEGQAKLEIVRYPFAKMLKMRPALDVPRVQDLDRLRGWALVGTLRFCGRSGETDRFARMQSGLRPVAVN